MSFLIHNGKFLKDNKALFTAENRSFRYGDGFFETMKIAEGKIMLSDLHFARMMSSMKILQLEIPDYFTPEYFSSLIFELCKKNNCSHLARVRITIFRAGGGLYNPLEHLPGFVIQAMPLSEKTLRLNENGLVMDIFPDAIKSADKFSAIKSNNCLPYIMAAIYTKENKLDEVIVCNQFARMADTIISNLFIVKNNIACTPPLSEGGINGVMRKYFLTNNFSFPVQEKIISAEDLLDADEVFLTNAIYGLRWVGQFREKKYQNKIGAELHQLAVDNRQ